MIWNDEKLHSSGIEGIRTFTVTIKVLSKIILAYKKLCEKILYMSILLNILFFIINAIIPSKPLSYNFLLFRAIANGIEW